MVALPALLVLLKFTTAPLVKPPPVVTRRREFSAVLELLKFKKADERVLLVTVKPCVLLELLIIPVPVTLSV
jgi:hypothetical protein